MQGSNPRRRFQLSTACGFKLRMKPISGGVNGVTSVLPAVPLRLPQLKDFSMNFIKKFCFNPDWSWLEVVLTVIILSMGWSWWITVPILLIIYFAVNVGQKTVEWE